MNKPIFILGSHKSGTSLLRNLLDGSDELFVVPFEAHFFQYAGFWVDYALRAARPQPQTFEQWHRSLVGNLEHENAKTYKSSRTSDSILSSRLNVTAFADYLRGNAQDCYNERDFRRLMDCYVEAIHISLYAKPPLVSRFVEKSVEQAEYAALIQKFYPDAKFIHIVRNPYATLVAIRQHITRSAHYPFLGKIIRSLENSYYYLYQNPLLIDNYLVLRYEDLVTNPAGAMKEVADFIEIRFHESLLKATSAGEKWAGNSTSGQSFSDISRDPLVTWQNKIVPIEIQLVNMLFNHVLQDFEYAQLPSRGSVFMPNRSERVRTYIANRFLLAQYSSDAQRVSYGS